MDENHQKPPHEWWHELSAEDARTLIDLVRMYQHGRRAAVKAIVTAIVGAIVAAIGYGIAHWIKTITLCAIAAMLVSMLSGCAGLEQKGVVLDTSVKGFKITLGADANSGTPLPNLSVGWGSNLLLTLPTEKSATLEYEKSSGSLFGSLFGIEVSDKTRVRIVTGDHRVTVESHTDPARTVTTEVANGQVAVRVGDD